MKKYLLLLVLVFSGIVSFCQFKKLEVVCEVYQDGVNYGKLEKFLPDSLKQSVLVSFRKYPFIGLELINVLCLNGWSLIGTSQKVDNTSSAGTYSTIVYHLKREIVVSEQEFLAIQERIKKNLR
jgi:hypothetical protein